jgi:hypothetical protein
MVQPSSASPHRRARAALRPAVIASLVVHAVLLLLAARGRMASGGEAIVPPAEAEGPAADVWAGDTSLPGSARLIDIDTQAGAAGRTGAEPAAARAADAVSAAASPAARDVEPNAAPAPPSGAPTPAAAPTAAPAPSPPPAARASKPPAAHPPKPPAKPRPSTDPAAALAAALEGGSRAASRAVDGASEATTDGAGPAPADGASGGGRFGAAGEPAGVRDLGRAFTRAIPPAVSSDPIWASLPAGPAGRYAVVVSVDASGRITGHRSSDRDPPRHLVKLVERTLALLESGTFALRGQVGAGTQALVLSVVLRDEAPEAGDGTRGLNLAFEYDGRRGKASFTQAGGRRVEVAIGVEQVTRTP